MTRSTHAIMANEHKFIYRFHHIIFCCLALDFEKLLGYVKNHRIKSFEANVNETPLILYFDKISYININHFLQIHDAFKISYDILCKDFTRDIEIIPWSPWIISEISYDLLLDITCIMVLGNCGNGAFAWCVIASEFMWIVAIVFNQECSLWDWS